jgi:hypothetical protein
MNVVRTEAISDVLLIEINNPPSTPARSACARA